MDLNTNSLRVVKRIEQAEDEAAPRRPKNPGRAVGIGGAIPAKQVAVMIETEPPADDGEPGWERGAPVGTVGADPAEPVLPKTLEDVGEPVERHIVTPAKRTGHPEQHVRVAIDQLLPRRFAVVRFRGPKSANQIGGEGLGQTGSDRQWAMVPRPARTSQVTKASYGHPAQY